jgi:hypothetical protein
VAVAAVVLVLLVGAVLGWHRWRSTRYVGTSIGVTLSWTGTNDILWTDADNGNVWWAGHDPRPHGVVEGAASAAQPSDCTARHWATGVVHFDDETHATFTSDAGGTLPLAFKPTGYFMTADCLMSPLNALSR